MTTSTGFEYILAVFFSFFSFFLGGWPAVSVPSAVVRVRNANVAGGLKEGCIAVDALDKVVKICAKNTTHRRRKVSFPAVHEAKQLGTLPQHSC